MIYLLRDLDTDLLIKKDELDLLKWMIDELCEQFCKRLEAMEYALPLSRDPSITRERSLYGLYLRRLSPLQSIILTTSELDEHTSIFPTFGELRPATVWVAANGKEHINITVF